MDAVSTGRAGELPLGRRVAYWRSRRGLSQQVFADRLGKSRSWVEKIERGVRRLDRFSVLHEIADVLQVDVQLLLGRPPARSDSDTSGVAHGMVEPIRAALTRHEALTQPHSEPTNDVGQLKRSLTHAWLCLGRADYDRLMRTLPGLLTRGQRTRADRRDQQSAMLLGQVYQLTADLLCRIGEHHLGWLAADRAVIVCADSGDPLWAGRAVAALAEVVRVTGRPRYATELALATAHRLNDPTTTLAEAPRLSIVGVLRLQAALGAAGTADAASATALLAQTRQVAEQVGTGHDHYHTHFGPALVGIARLATAVELGHGPQALPTLGALAARPDYQRLPAAVRAAHLIQTARAHLQAGDPSTAGQALLDAARTAPAEVSTRPIARAILTTVLRHVDRPGPITRLAKALGVTV